MSKNTITSESDVYQRVSLLGSGTYGVVSLVTNRKGIPCAIKEISLPTAESDKDMLLYLEREIRNLQKLSEACDTSPKQDCPIVKYIETFKDKAKTYIVMELADGGDLNEYISETFASKKGVLQEEFILETKVKLAKQILDGLAFIHKHGIVHGDIKPENVLIKEGKIKFSDFGISCMYAPENECTYTAGTRSHLDPRLLNGTLQPRQISKETDMYSLGVLLYNLFEVGIFFEGHKIAPIQENFNKNYDGKKGELKSKRDLYANSKKSSKSSSMWSFLGQSDDSSVSLYTTAARYYDLMIHLLRPYPASRVSIDQAIQFMKDGNLDTLSEPAQIQKAATAAAAVPPPPLTEADIRRRIQELVDIVFEDLKEFASSSEIINVSKVKEELNTPVNKEHLDKLKWENISQIVSNVIEAKLKQSNSNSMHASSGGGVRQKKNRKDYKKTDKKVRVAGRERCVYMDAKRKRYIKRNGMMVPV